MKIDSPLIVWKRILVLGLLAIVALFVIDRFLVAFRLEEERSRLILNELHTHKVLSNELYSLFHGVQDDFKFFEKKIGDILRSSDNSSEYQNNVKSLIDFLETHDGYFKVRVTNSKGQEIFKILLNENHTAFYHSKALFDLSGQSFYQDLNKVTGNEFYFSSMEANIINGVVERPIRPTVRVSKRIVLPNNDEGLLIFNIDGMRVIKLFSSDKINLEASSELSFVDQEGKYLASWPSVDNEVFLQNKISIKDRLPVFSKIQSGRPQNSIITPEGIIVYSEVLLPQTNKKWYLISRIPQTNWTKSIQKERLTWFFWELLILAILMIWLLKDEMKRHKDEVVKVLLRERSEFIQNVSHQLKTPLAIMINSLENKSPDQKDWIELKKEVKYLIKVVDDMLLLAQVDSYKNLSLKQENVLEIVTEAVDMIGPKAKEKGVQIRFNVDDKILTFPENAVRPAMGDLLKSAIVNVLDNAIDFTSEGGTVEVYVAYDGPKIAVQIRDSGSGVPEEFMPHLFTRFSRGNSSRKGTGLGLSISKKIIDLHNGEILLASNSNGATFEIKL